MPRNPASDARKLRVANCLEERIGPLTKPFSSRLDWYCSNDGKIHVFITDSKVHYSKRPWFDMKLSDITTLAGYTAGFIIFFLGSETNFLVIPAAVLKSRLKDYKAGPRSMEEGHYHFNLHGRSFLNSQIGI